MASDGDILRSQVGVALSHGEEATGSFPGDMPGDRIRLNGNVTPEAHDAWLLWAETHVGKYGLSSLLEAIGRRLADGQAVVFDAALAEEAREIKAGNFDRKPKG